MTTTDRRVKNLRPLLPPAILKEEIPLRPQVASFVHESREAISNIIAGHDDRLICIVGPCSIHDVVAAKEYAARLAGLANQVKDDLLVVMRVYFEKPRTTVGWKGLINDPHLDGSFDINRGLRIGRSLLVDVNELGLPVGTELLDTISPQFMSDLISWGAIGARTTESQLHRELVSGLSFPVGFKNGSSGDVQIAADAMVSSGAPHSFLGVSEQGNAAIVETAGNPSTHVILRGGVNGPNYDPVHVESAVKTVKKAVGAGAPAAIVIDCSHGNSGKDHKKQPMVVAHICTQVASGSRDIVGCMIESFLVEGAQKLSEGPDAAKNLIYGMSITDKCVNWDTTVAMLQDLAQAARTRREGAAPTSKL